MATSLDIRTDRAADGTPRVVAAGEIDLSNVEVFAQALTAAGANARDGVKTMTIDLSDVQYLDSAAINTLFQHADDIDHIRLVVHPFLVSVLTISGLAEIATIEPVTGPASA